MEVAIEKAKEYINALKDSGKFTFEDIANLSGIPVGTIRNICTGKTPDARFGTIAKIVISLGGDLNQLVGYEKTREIEVNSTVSMKETYEMRIADLINSYEARISDIKAMCETRIADILSCCDKRISDTKQNYEERMQAYRDFIENNK